MALSTNDQNTIREYLLGHLSQEEQEKIEERLMVEDDLFDELEISKGELIEEYCAGELLPKDRQWFERSYLASPEGRQRYAMAVALTCLPSPKRVEESPGFFEKLTAFFGARWAMASVASLLLVSFVVFMWLRSTQRPGTTVPVALVNSIPSRSNGDNSLPSRVKLPPDASDLRASLTLLKQFPQGTRFQAILDNQTDRKAVSVVDHKDKVVTVVIPASELPRGTYALELTAFSADGTEEPIPGSYRFNID